MSETSINSEPVPLDTPGTDSISTSSTRLDDMPTSHSGEMTGASVNATPDSGPISAVATAAATRLAPVATELRARVPASRAALDAAGRVVSRAARDTDAVLHREMQIPETQRLRDTGREFFSALVSVGALYLSRGISLAEQRLHVSPSNRDDRVAENVVTRLRHVTVAAILSFKQSAFGMVYPHGTRRSQRPGGESDIPTQQTSNQSIFSKVVDIFREMACQAKVVVGDVASRTSQYRGDYHEYITPLAGRVANICGSSGVSRPANEQPVGETIGTLPFYPDSSDSNLAAMDSSKEE